MGQESFSAHHRLFGWTHFQSFSLYLVWRYGEKLET